MACTLRKGRLNPVCDVDGEWSAFRIMLDQQTAMGSEYWRQKIGGAVCMDGTLHHGTPAQLFAINDAGLAYCLYEMSLRP